ELNRNEIVSLMIGQSMEELFPPARPPVDKAVMPSLRLEKVSFAHELSDVSFCVRPGEIFGLGGIDGQGQQRVPEAIFGTLSGVSGTIEVGGKPFKRRSPYKSKGADFSIAFIPEDRKTEGMVQSLSIEENMRLTRLGLGGGTAGTS